MKRMVFSALVVLGCLTGAAAQDAAPLWLRYPAISPDGQTVLFEYKGDIWSVPAAGGNAIPMTLGEAYESAPVWSHDGKWVAFASDRYGSFDVFVMPSTGGEAKRLTYHSTREVPSSFTADDKAVLFSASRQDLATNAQFPVGGMTELYSVPVTGGRVSQVLTTPALDATVSSTGDKIIFHDYKGYESDWRKHHTSAVTRDICVYDTRSKTYTRLSGFEGEDRNPVFDANDDDFYYLSEQNGSFNVFKSSLRSPKQATPVTRLSKHPVRFLTRAKNGTLAFSYDGELYTLKPGGDPRKIAVRIAADGRNAIERFVPINGGITGAKLSPNGKEFVFGFRGEIFVSSIDGKFVKRITNTPWQERTASFAPDGRMLVYAAEQNNNWNVYTVSLTRASEPYFFASTVLKEEAVVATPAEEFQPAFSPDGKEIAYLENRQTLRVYNLASKTSRTVLPGDLNYSYADGDQYYAWSPDSKWLLVQFAQKERMFTPEVGIVAADGKSEVRNLTESGYDDTAPKWAVDGKMMIWGTTRDGARAQGGDSVAGDVYGMYFTKAFFDRAKLSKEEFALVKEREDKEKKEAEEKAKKEAEDKAKTTGQAAKPAAATPEPVAIDWDGLKDRKLRLTINTSEASDWVLSKDGEKLYYLTSFEKGNDLWVTEVRSRDTKLLAKLGATSASMELSSDGKFLFVLADGRAVKVEAENGKSEPIAITTEMVLDYPAEKAYIFDHSWRQFKQKQIFPDLQKVDWDFYYAAYKKFLPHINNNWDFAEMLSEMLGEANVSHTGASYRPTTANMDATASLGLLYDYGYAGEGLRIAEVIQGGPVDLAASTTKAGHVIEADRRHPHRRVRRLLQAAQPQGGEVHAAVGLRPLVGQAVGRDGEADQRRRRRGTAVQALGPPAPRRHRAAVGGQGRLRPRPLDERRQHARGVRGGARAEHRQGRDRRGHALQWRRRHPRAALRLPQRQEVLRRGAARAVRRRRAVRQVDQAVDRAGGREQLLGRAPLPPRVHGEAPGPPGGDAGARDRHVRLVGEPD